MISALQHSLVLPQAVRSDPRGEGLRRKSLHLTRPAYPRTRSRVGRRDRRRRAGRAWTLPILRTARADRQGRRGRVPNRRGSVPGRVQVRPTAGQYSRRHTALRAGDVPGGDARVRRASKGAVYHYASRRRREVVFDDELRSLTEETVHAVRRLLSTSTVPPPVADARCPKCSLFDACMPFALAGVEREAAWLYDLRK